MDNRVYYGEYSLKHWIELILKKNIILPDYQRFFVWDETKVEKLIQTLKKKEFVPPVTIGAFKNDNQTQNLIIDGQQRLTSLLLAYLGIYPDKVAYKKEMELYADENDSDVDEAKEDLDNVLEWNFNKLLKKGGNKKEIIEKISFKRYKELNCNIDNNFISNTFLGFSYLVPYISDEKDQQRYYSSVFRNINAQGEPLLAQESRASLYYLDKNLADFFKPDFFSHFEIRNSSNVTKADFVRYVAMLFQYKKDGNTNRIARGFKQKMESYYEEYIYSVVGENPSQRFADFSTVFPKNKYHDRLKSLSDTLDSLSIPKRVPSIIDLDLYIFGLIYTILFQNKKINVDKKTQLLARLKDNIQNIKNDDSHTRAPASLKYLKTRIDTSIETFSHYAE